MVDRFERFSFNMMEISRYWHKLASDVMETHGLKGPQSVYFTTLYRYPEGLTAARLAELCSRDKGDVSRAISLFEEKGLLEKPKENRRSYRAPLILTEAGRQVAERINDKVRIAVEAADCGLTGEDRETFYHALELIRLNLRELTEKEF